ncbi:MAG: electron transfer flavoprotein subunit beta/FixA family protein [Acidimicrobiia bacterium]|nr:MAG: electron transfer flavoprotein subunit beta/FixA family protein [Acidimicrobiia bacterium]
MDIGVLLRAVPDPVEELELNDDETDLDRDYLGYVLNEFDEHALEEALLLKEDTDGSVTAYALGTADEVEQMLFTAIAKGADKAVKVGDGLGALDAHAQADLFVGALGEHDLILCGVQASDEIDGQVAMLVSAKLGHPHVSVVVGTSPGADTLTITKEYWAGITASYEVSLPAVLGIQAARQAPRYVAVSRIRQAQESGALTETDADPPSSSSGITITAVRIPETGAGAEMIDGDEEAAADRIIELLAAAGVGGAA